MSERLRVDPIACTGHGICAELFPEWIGLDDWGYPIVESGPIPEELRVHAHRAVAACPKLALVVVEDEAPAAPRRRGGTISPKRG